METQSSVHYNRIAEAIEYIRQHFKKQPTLDEIARQIHLSPAHFQRLFTEWAGTSPKKFLQYTSINHARKILKEQQTSLFDAAYETGLSGTSRLHDLFVRIEGMTPGEYKTGGRDLSIHYDFSESPFGKLIVASTSKGICHMAFTEDEQQGEETLRSKFPHASFKRASDRLQQNALLIFQKDWSRLSDIKLHLKGTDFQLKVWESLLKIPMGKLATYGNIARQIGQPDAARAVGTAIGSNPIAFLIPCHRVIQSSGILGGYMWGPTRKAAMICWECAQTDM